MDCLFLPHLLSPPPNTPSSNSLVVVVLVLLVCLQQHLSVSDESKLIARGVLTET
jgi:hypothetical protein